MTFETLCRRNGIDRLDLLLIDVEGYDWDLIRAIDFERGLPRLVAYEHYHLAPHERAACRAYMERLGYEAMEEHFDTFCLLPRDDDLTSRFRKLRPGLPGIAAYEEEGR